MIKLVRNQINMSLNQVEFYKYDSFYLLKIYFYTKILLIMEKYDKNSKFQTGMASEFLVMSVLFRLGFNPQLTLGNNKRVDIIVPSENYDKWITIDVKSVRGFDSIPVGNIKVEDNHFIVIVIYKNKLSDITTLPEFYIVPSFIVAQKAVNYKTGPTDLFKKDIKDDYFNNWNILKEYLI